MSACTSTDSSAIKPLLGDRSQRWQNSIHAVQVEEQLRRTSCASEQAGRLRSTARRAGLHSIWHEDDAIRMRQPRFLTAVFKQRQAQDRHQASDAVRRICRHNDWPPRAIGFVFFHGASLLMVLVSDCPYTSTAHVPGVLHLIQLFVAWRLPDDKIQHELPHVLPDIFPMLPLHPKL